MDISTLTALGLASLFSFGQINQDTQVNTYKLPAIAGLWQIELDEGNTCREFYNFGRNDELTTTSGQEKTTGEYRLIELEDSSLSVLAVRTEHDNNAPDCSGSQIDQSGESLAVFVKLDTRHNPKKMQWCSDDEGQECFATLYRILP